MSITPRLLSFLQLISRTPDAAIASIADNFIFDERTSNKRWDDFESLLPTTNLTRDNWKESCKTYTESRVAVPTISVPDAFLDINRQAWKESDVGNQTVVRIESLMRPLGGNRLEYLEDLLERVASQEGDASQALKDFFNTWNTRRDNRPSFVAFYDEVKNEADSDHWPHDLSDRLGLGHYKGLLDAPIPVAQMRYTLQDVFDTQKSKKLSTACALPTILDGGMHEFFFPVPSECSYGATLHLNPDQAALLTAEMLHCRINYKPKHLYKIGLIARTHSLRDDSLRQARDLHLLSLRMETGRHDFAEDLVGRP